MAAIAPLVLLVFLRNLVLSEVKLGRRLDVVRLVTKRIAIVSLTNLQLIRFKVRKFGVKIFDNRVLLLNPVVAHLYLPVKLFILAQ